MPETERCAECLSLFPKGELMAFPGFFVCSECKPAAVAKLARGEPVGAIWRKGRRLVMRLGVTFPDRCVFCNAEANGFRIKKTYYWHHPAIYLFILTPVVSFLAYLVVAIIVRKSVTLQVPLCPAHRKRRVRYRFIALGVFLASLGLLAAGINFNSPEMAVAALPVFIGALIVAAFAERLLVAARIDRTHVVLSGAGAAFRAGFPDWPEA